jgi:hypothetical protein
MPLKFRLSWGWANERPREWWVARQRRGGRQTCSKFDMFPKGANDVKQLCDSETISS